MLAALGGWESQAIAKRMKILSPVHFDAHLLHQCNVLLVFVEKVICCVPCGSPPDLARHLDKRIPDTWALASTVYCPLNL